MLCIINYNPDKDLVSLRFSGKLNYKLAEQYSVEAKKLADENKCNKFLLDHSETKQESRGIYRLHTDGAALEKFGFKKKDRVAIVLSEKDKSEQIKKIENCAKWCSLNYFSTIEDAMRWLENCN